MTDSQENDRHFDATLTEMINTDVVPVKLGKHGGLAHFTEKFGPFEVHETGWIQAMTVRPGFSLVMGEIRNAHQSQRDYLSDDHLKLHFKIDGKSVISGDNEEHSDVPAGVMAFLVQPPNTPKQEIVGEQRHYRAVTLVCSREFVADLLPASDLNLVSSIRDYLRGPSSRFSYDNAPLSLSLRSVVEDLLNVQQGPRSELMLEAKALELLYLSMGQLADPGLRDLQSLKNRRKVQDLCFLLESGEGYALSIKDLARHLAWNETQMMEAFKRTMGMPIANYRQKLSMDRALRQLRTTELSVTHISLEAGYEHPGNFATAFKKRFGFSPRAARGR